MAGSANSQTVRVVSGVGTRELSVSGLTPNRTVTSGPDGTWKINGAATDDPGATATTLPGKLVLNGVAPGAERSKTLGCGSVVSSNCTLNGPGDAPELVPTCIQ